MIDGSELFRYDYESGIELSGAAEITLGTSEAAASFEKIHVYRDIFYTCEGEHAVRGAQELGPDEYFALGDNSASSKDSRRWGTVPAQNMLGRGFIIFWPIPQIKFIK
jgi:signal peptidase I